MGDDPFSAGPARGSRFSKAAAALALIALCIAGSPTARSSEGGGATALPVPPPPCTTAASAESAAVSSTSALTVAWSLFRDGCFDRARERAVGLGEDTSRAARERAEAFALGARATLSAVMVDPLAPDAASLIDQAEHLAARAVRLDDTVVEGHLQRAIALGLQARAAGAIEAASGGYAEEARAHIDAAMALAPEEPYALAVDGAWHFEVVTGAGSLAASMIYGAAADEGESRFEAARTRPGASLMIDVQYAVAALVLDHKRHRERARTALEAARTKTPETAVEQFHFDLAGVLLERLASPEGSRAGARLAAAVQGRQGDQ
ncbi:MAG: hypothetical protein ACFB6R_13910 [Alphaproteobacteria bacterium]